MANDDKDGPLSLRLFALGPADVLTRVRGEGQKVGEPGLVKLVPEPFK